MQLKSCYIENYGKIKEQSFDFKAGLTSFLKNNGEGKTTLASFLKAMFYGLDGYRSGSKDFNDRQHFYPFAGGKFGGSVVFTSDGKTYKIERTFDEKSKTKDQCRVYCNNVLDQQLGDQIGEQIFGLDKTSFERTIFVTADDIEFATTDSINSKLNNIVIGGDGETHLTEAIAILTEAAKRYKKTKGSGNDLLSKESDRLHILDEQIANAAAIQAALPAQYAQLQTCDEQIAALREKLDQVQVQGQIAEQWRTYDALVAEADAAEQSSVNLLHKYPHGLCSDEVLAAIKKTATEYSVLQARSQKQPASNQSTLPDDNVVQDLDAQLQNYLALEREAATLPDYAVNGVAVKPQRQRLYPLLAGLAVILCLAGAGVLFVQQLVGIILLVVGGVGLLAVAFLYLNHKAGVTAPVPNPAKQALLRQREQLGDQIRTTLARYGYATAQGVAAAVGDLKHDREQSLADSAVRAELTQYQTALQNFCERYALNNADYVAAINQFERDFNQYQQYQTDVARLRDKAAQYRQTNHLTKRPNRDSSDATALNDAWEKLTTERHNLLRTITDHESEAEKLEDLRQERELTRQRQNEYKATHALLQKTVEYLQTAATNLQDRCLRPLKDQFVQYANLLEKTIGEKLVMNADFAIMYEHHGVNRSSQHLSAGQKSLCALCFRLALIDQMFPQEKPFMIFDDPLVHLDAEHLTKARNLLRELANTHQIIYFTCHDSRNLA